MLYFAYGMNTNTKEMARRCPVSRYVGSAWLPDFELVFSVHCDIRRKDGAGMYGVLWDITDQCLASLDQLEGHPTYYDRGMFAVKHNGLTRHAMCYYMTDRNRELCPPTREYLDMVIDGYFQNLQWAPDQLVDALNRSGHHVRV